MIEYLILISCVFFLIFLVPTQYRQYAAIVGWTGMVLYLFAEIPYYLSINNFLYPLLAVLSVPFLIITIRLLLKSELRVMQLSTAAAVAFLIYAPFEFIPALGNWLISVVVGQVFWVLNVLNYNTLLVAWDMFQRYGYRIEIILACTGIQGIAIMLGVASAVPSSWRQKFFSFLLVVPTIYILNIARNVAVIIAYTEQWFPYLTEIAGNGENGYESFFWAHNVIAEGLALVLLIGIAYGLFRINPGLAEFARALTDRYYHEVYKLAGKTPPGPPPVE
ncbi:MAG: archaeosortase A [Methanoregulaceae archaeon]|jgi:archaeosortase A (PGF-CTERM-specific)|nr:archaeosortase A [Methanoregulaceae archaeon]